VDFTWIDGERVIRFGSGALEEAPHILAGRDFEDYALLTSQRAFVSKLREDAAPLGKAVATVVRVPAGPVDVISADIRDEVEGRPIVALGGGRVIDAAKAIGGADDLLVAAIPTTLSGAEMTRFHRMPAGYDGWKLMRPSVVIADPELMASAPMPELAASAMNALAHAMEALYASLANPVASAAALRASSDIAGALSDGEPDRRRLALGALLAGYAVGSAGLAVHHIVCQTIVRVCGTPHAETNAVMLPHFARMMERNAPGPMAAFAVAVGAGEGGAGDRVAELAARSGVTRLSELGVSAGSIPSVVEGVGQRPDLANSPGPPTLEDVRGVLEAAL
jgi:alcohol dehydrogenase class IV